MTRLMHVAAGLSAALLGTTAAAAGSPIVVQGGPSARISYADLDLSKGAGVEALRSRVRGAARHLCIEEGTQPLRNHMAGQKCYKQVLADGNSQIELAARGGSSSFVAMQAITLAAPR